MFYKNILSLRNEGCTACGACENICPTGSIKMVEDCEGFLYPDVNIDKCINCGKCQLVCPLLNEITSNNRVNPQIYAAWSLDDEIRMNSSAGGIFSELANSILSENGYVVGARYNEMHLVEHCIVNNEIELSLLRKSKYVQSKIGLIFREIKELLDKNEHVMFVGTPCQTCGLVGFLNKEYDNLLLCDLVCHGVNSPTVYLKYLEQLESKYKSKIKSIDFRDKKNGWKNFGTRVVFKDNQEYYKDQRNESFYRGFIKNLYLRPSCYKCRYKTFPRFSDITLADFWGIERCYEDVDIEKGISLIMIHSKKGQEYLDKIDGRIFKLESNLDAAIQYNPCIMKSSRVDENKRKIFFEELKNHKNISDIIKNLI